MKPIIEFRNIGKKFRINRRQKPYVSLRENILECLKNPGIFFEKKEEFWALKDITFDVMPGESIGVIGKNGAGKTTLLKILSRITPPTSGEIKVRGRVASLLEVGTGFHPELTGRENIFFNGAILGMKRKEIKRKFDEIVDFSGVEKFIDTPLKHYSSGMQLRLAFAVAAFLEAEILVVDEVLAVGDAEFQKKCMGKMEDVTKNEGRTVLFVSHNMGAVKELCYTGILLNQGKVQNAGDINHVVSDYLKGQKDDKIYKKDYGIIREISLYTNNKNGTLIYAGCELHIKLTYILSNELEKPVIGFVFRDEFNQSLLGINNLHFKNNIQILKKQGEILIHIPFLPLYQGHYSIDVYFGDKTKDYEVVRSALSFYVEKAKHQDGELYPDNKINKIFLKDASWFLQ